MRYKSYEYCKDIKCVKLENKDGFEKCFHDACMAKSFHKWLDEKQYIIIKNINEDK